MQKQNDFIERKLRWILLALVAAEITLLVTETLPLEWSATLIVLTEGSALAFTLSIFIPRAYAVRKRVKQGVLVTTAIRDEFKTIIPSPLLKLAANELGMFSSIIRFLLRKIDIPANSIAIDYGRSFRMMGFILLALTPIEILLIDAICHKFIPDVNYIRVFLIALSLYACIWIVGMLLSTKVFPHYIDKEKVVIRYGYMHRIDIPLTCIKAVSITKKDCEGMKIIYYDEGTLVMNNGMRECEIGLEIESPSLIKVDGSHCDENTRYIFFSVDNPSSVNQVISERLTVAL